MMLALIFWSFLELVACQTTESKGDPDTASSEGEKDAKQTRQLSYIIFIVAVSVTILIMSCIMLQRYYLYRTKSCPASQAPIEACTYFTNGYYKKLLTITKRERSDLLKKIKVNHDEIVQNHIPPLCQEANSTSAPNSTFLRCATSDPSSSSNTARNTPDKPQKRPPVSFCEMKRRHNQYHELRHRGSSNQKAAYDESLRIGSAAEPVPSYVYRREALEYGLKIDRALVNMNPSDERLWRSHEVDISAHITKIRNYRDPGRNRSEYDALRLIKNYDGVADALRQARFGPEPFMQRELERTRNLVDELVRDINVNYQRRQ